MFNPFRNLSVNLNATGPAAVIIVWVAAVAALGLWGGGETSERALNILAFAGGVILASLASRS
jgi:hypothetical protein